MPRKNLSAIDTTKSFYNESFANFLLDIYDRNFFDEHRFLNLGNANGEIINCLKEKNCFEDVIGTNADRNIVLEGRNRFNLGSCELINCPAEELNLNEESISFVLCKHFLENTNPKKITPILNNIYNLLVPGGNFFVIMNKLVLQKNNSPEMWCNLFTLHGFKVNIKMFISFQSSKHRPIQNVSSTFYNQFREYWTVFCISKEFDGDSRDLEYEEF